MLIVAGEEVGGRGEQRLDRGEQFAVSNLAAECRQSI